MRRNTKPEQVEILSFEDNEASRLLFGEQNANLRALAGHLDIEVSTRGGDVTLSGPKKRVALALKSLNQLYEMAEERYPLTTADVIQALGSLEKEPKTNLTTLYQDKVILNTNCRKSVSPKSVAQKRYVNAIRHQDLVFAIGPAGTGKTYLAMALAISTLLAKSVKRIVLTRPAVEAGERLGFLPGDIEEKVNPYLRPLYDALYDMVDIERARGWMSQGIVEVAPLAFMRGRTLNDSFIILDEAQNTTPEQMKMFLTRMGFGSKAVVTGDITQIDLPANTDSGLILASRLLEHIEGIEVCRFDERDVVRHPLVQRIVKAYEQNGGDAK